MRRILLNRSDFRLIVLGVLGLILSACAPEIAPRQPRETVPATYDGSDDSSNAAKISWREYFRDTDLAELIEVALNNNQELNIFLQELEVAKNEVTARSGAYLPFVDLGAEVGIDKVGRYTRDGALEANNDIKPGKEFPEPLPNFLVGAHASWEVDIWHKLRDAEKSAISRFLASNEGRKFLVTNLISEIAGSYYELRALDAQLGIVRQNIDIQSNALETVKLEKQGARVTELALRRFEAQLFKTKSLQFEILQRITETENRVNFLVGRFPQPISRSTNNFEELLPEEVKAGIPSQLLENRPDIRQAELEIVAADLDIQVAKAGFYPSLSISADVGYQAYKLSNAIKTPESLLYTLTSNLTGPFINRLALNADFLSANAKQIQAVFNFERTLLGAFIEVANQLSNIKNLQSTYEFKSQQVQALTDSVEISNVLFRSARADYTEVLLTQRDALEARFDLIETKLQQMLASVAIYRALGGGWG